ncbi:hypothetical protein J3Q64DRAFT_1698980 [Phycomyces blakesleeanus]|uniref:Uncharacterized protein n=2 Tax=Phycomyces blakesleeanus TaxID=4837 RepID=A0A167MM48_PHYB8|nr:hypothetical protein PHYBLDRAFT_168602 [Phycomyces blakesleeanus NRRL 1555(-)]OAD73249.1 hypothetical protein PHYBLDRAFT_168602 [Phycomyces blakesleeanus NRRL 1555(-)]|eukprot:XP_018291289.1 hypothetical protein PHYBLDRAFT_168602 [Phycomyces blakesleeanus NRRL 1555(-)]
MHKFILLLLLLISFEMTIALPNLPFLEARGVDLATTPACNGCLDRCKKSSDPYCSADCCWVCIPGRGGYQTDYIILVRRAPYSHYFVFFQDFIKTADKSASILTVLFNRQKTNPSSIHVRTFVISQKIIYYKPQNINTKRTVLKSHNTTES